MFGTLKTAATGAAMVFDGMVHFALGSVVAFCGLMLALPLVLGSLPRMIGG